MSDDQTRDYYRRRAAEYEQIYYRDDEARRRELRAIASRLEVLGKDRTVLELACGTGYWTVVLSRTAQRVTAVDLSPEMLIEARRKDYGCPVDFVQGDLYELPFSPGQADLLALGFWFSHEPRENLASFLDYLKTLVDSEGTIWMVDNNPPAEGPISHHVRYDEHGNNYKRRFLDDGTEFVILKNYFEEAELRGILEPVFVIDRLDYGTHYWSVELRLR
jgi:ubiquinone/menaquinone biosynthesis C-methylase UbiE